MTEQFEINAKFQAKPADIYTAWLDSEKHTAMTGGDAQCSDQVGESFYAWDGYITGSNIELIENQKIVQSWRTSEFDEADEDSVLSITLEEVEGGTQLVLNHSNIPEGQTQYKQGWMDHYFVPMAEYFNKG